MKVNIIFGHTLVKDITAIKFVINPSQTRYDDPNEPVKSTYNVTAIIISDGVTIRETLETNCTDKKILENDIKSILDDISTRMLQVNDSQEFTCIIELPSLLDEKEDKLNAGC